jgi:hypothetical protein
MINNSVHPHACGDNDNLIEQAIRLGFGETSIVVEQGVIKFMELRFTLDVREKEI